MALRICLFSIAAVLLGAHFFRVGNLAMLALCLSAPLLFILKSRWSLHLLQSSAYGAVAVWIDVAIGIIEWRRQVGQPWLAAGAILASVTLFSLLAGLLLNNAAVRQHYR